jgi:hypothetical protein
MPDGGTRPRLPYPPFAMCEEEAARYLSLSPTTFRQHVMPQVPAIRLTSGRIAWLREQLEAWALSRPTTGIDAAPQPAEAGPQEPPHARPDIAAALAALAPARRARR